MARRMAAVAALLRHRVAVAERAEERHEYTVIDGFEQTTAEVAAAMNLSPAAASYLVSYAKALDTRLPNVAALLAEGRTDWRTVRLIISRTDLVTDDELIAKLDQSLAARIGKWHGWSRQRIVNAVDATVRAADPDAARERREAAEDERHIGITALDNGMAEIYGTVAAAAATAFDRRLSQLAKQVCSADPRTLDQRRADALAALTQGRRLACACGQSDCPTRAESDATAERDPGAARFVINVVASEADRLRGQRCARLSGRLRSHRRRAGSPIGRRSIGSHRQSAYEPGGGAALPAIRGAGARGALQGSHVPLPRVQPPAVVCDIDHTIPFNHEDPAAGGRTVFWNMKCLCRQHHRLKTFGGWLDTQLADGTVIWTSPAGQTYRTSPAGSDLFPQPRRPACAPPSASRRNQAKQRSARIAQARKHNREQRPVNEARRRLEEARKEEIAARKFRNHMRDMLFLFKATPSTSPFCRWVNDPREPEELPADWIPDKPAVTALPDDPPF